LLFKIGAAFAEKEVKGQFNENIKKTSFEMEASLSDKASNKSNEL